MQYLPGILAQLVEASIFAAAAMALILAASYALL